MRQEVKSQFYDFRLDNAGKLYPALHSKRRTTMFRVAAVMKNPVRVSYLEEAASHMMTRCPYYQVTLRRGVFWYYLEKVDTLPLIHADSVYPCMHIPLNRKNALPFRIIAYRNRIAFEASHLLADGKAAIAFLNGLILEYLKLQGEKVTSGGAILDCDESPDPEEFSDGYKRIFEKNVPKNGPSPKVAQLRGTALSPPQHRVIEGRMLTRDLKEQAGIYGVTIGEYLSALLLKVLCEREFGKKRIRPVTVTIPIDVRQFYPSKTMRNFMLTLEPTIDPRLGNISFEYIVHRVHNYMQSELDRHLIKMQIA